MTTAGLYETSGDWLFDIGLPGKSGIGGGIVTVSPGKGGRDFCPAARQCGQQRQGTTGGQIPFSAARNGSVRLATRDLIARQYEIIGPIPPIISSGKNKPMRTATVSNTASAARNSQSMAGDDRHRHGPADLRSADIVQMLASFNGAPGLQFPVHIKEIAQSRPDYADIHGPRWHEGPVRREFAAWHDGHRHSHVSPRQYFGRPDFGADRRNR